MLHCIDDAASGSAFPCGPERTESMTIADDTTSDATASGAFKDTLAKAREALAAGDWEVDRRDGEEFLFQSLEPGMIHGDVLHPRIYHQRERNKTRNQNGKAANPLISKALVSINAQVELRILF